MNNLNQSRFTARIEFLMLRYQVPAIVISSVLLLSPLALIPFIGELAASLLLASGTLVFALLVQGQIAKRLFKGPPASAALIGVARDMLPSSCRNQFDRDVANELGTRNNPRVLPTDVIQSERGDTGDASIEPVFAVGAPGSAEPGWRSA